MYYIVSYLPGRGIPLREFVAITRKESWYSSIVGRYEGVVDKDTSSAELQPLRTRGEGRTVPGRITHPAASLAAGAIVSGHSVLPASMAALLYCCPITGGNPQFCPLHDVREMPADQALAWMEQLNTEDKRFLWEYHRCCADWEILKAKAAWQGPQAALG